MEGSKRLVRAVLLLALVGVTLVLVGVLWAWRVQTGHAERVDRSTAAMAERGEPATLPEFIAARPVEPGAVSFATFLLELRHAREIRAFDLDEVLARAAGWQAPERSASPRVAVEELADSLGIEESRRTDDEGRLARLGERLERALDGVDAESKDHPGTQLDRRLLEARREGRIPEAAGPEQAWVRLVLAEGEDTLDALDRLPAVARRDLEAELDLEADVFAILELQSAFPMVEAARLLDYEVTRALIEDGPQAVDAFDAALRAYAGLFDLLGSDGSLEDLAVGLSLLRLRTDLLRWGGAALAGNPDLDPILARERQALQALDLLGLFRRALVGSRLTIDWIYRAFDPSEASAIARETNVFTRLLLPLILKGGHARLLEASDDLLARIDRAGLELGPEDGPRGFTMPEPPERDLVGQLLYPRWDAWVESAAEAERGRRLALCALTARLDGFEALDAALARWPDPIDGEPFRLDLDQRGRRVLGFDGDEDEDEDPGGSRWALEPLGAVGRDRDSAGGR